MITISPEKQLGSHQGDAEAAGVETQTFELSNDAENMIVLDAQFIQFSV